MFNFKSPFVKVFICFTENLALHKPAGRVVLLSLILEQTLLWTDSTQTYVGGQDSVRRHTGDKQQSGGWI